MNGRAISLRKSKVDGLPYSHTHEGCKSNNYVETLWGVSFHHGLNCLVRKEMSWLLFSIKRENLRFIIEIVWLSPLYIYIQYIIHGCNLGVKRCFLSTGCRMLCLLDPTKVDDALALITDLADNLEDRTLEVSHLHFVLHLTLLFRCLNITAGRYLKSSGILHLIEYQ